MKKSQATTKVESVSIERLKQFSSTFGLKAAEYLVAGLTFEQASYQFAIFERDQATERCQQLKTEVENKTVQELALSVLLKQLQAFN